MRLLSASASIVDPAIFTTIIALAAVPQAACQTTHMENARMATEALQEIWYNGQTGLYNSTGWWNSANAITTLADMTAVNPNVLDRTTESIFKNTFNQAQLHNLGVRKYNATHECDGIADDCPDNDPEVISEKGWLNGYYDDEAWWALAWITVWDFTKDDSYLDAATDIFEDMVNTGANATCGGIWWNKKHTQVNAVTNELFISVAAKLANRKPNGDYYLAWAKKMYAWFLNSGLINLKGNINDRLDLETCENSFDAVWTYNQGIIIGALVELERADPSDGVYIRKAQRIANAALSNPELVYPDGVLHERNEPDQGQSGPNFKGIFIRNLGILNAAVRDDKYAKFIQKNADAIWGNARGDQDMLGPVWSGPTYPEFTNAATHSSAMDALVAASTLNPEEGGYIGAFKRSIGAFKRALRPAYRI